MNMEPFERYTVLYWNKVKKIEPSEFIFSNVKKIQCCSILKKTTQKIKIIKKCHKIDTFVSDVFSILPDFGFINNMLVWNRHKCVNV